MVWCESWCTFSAESGRKVRDYVIVCTSNLAKVVHFYSLTILPPSVEEAHQLSHQTISPHILTLFVFQKAIMTSSRYGYFARMLAPKKAQVYYSPAFVFDLHTLT